MAGADATLRVEIVYALADAQALERLTLPAGATVRQALEKSDLPRRFPEIDLKCAAVGIYGMRVALNTVLNDGDRVEIYRPLQADPKESRRRRAHAGRTRRV